MCAASLRSKAPRCRAQVFNVPHVEKEQIRQTCLLEHGPRNSPRDLLVHQKLRFGIQLQKKPVHVHLV